jgi:hypothetical protein
MDIVQLGGPAALTLRVGVCKEGNDRKSEIKQYHVLYITSNLLNTMTGDCILILKN